LQFADGVTLPCVLAPFPAFYCKTMIIDYFFYPEEDSESEGFILNNRRQQEFKGKFWREDDSLIPTIN
jgi:hypothetical protein